MIYKCLKLVLDYTLTDAVYGENTTLTENPNRYTERVLEYTANGNIRRFQRHGLKDDGKYGKIDNLHLTYDGNQLRSVLDDAAAVTRYASADFPDLTDNSTEYTYDERGALTSDTNQGIESISYDDLGNPRLMKFRSGAETEYVYTPDGRKVREIHRTPSSGILKAVIGPVIPPVLVTKADTTDYIGPTIYRSGSPEMVRYAGGFATLSLSGGKYVPDFYHYLTDYLGNNRAVVRASTGVADQVTHYYPWGSVYGDMGSGASLQPFKYGDKELDLSNGVARYDYSARAYFPSIPRFASPDRYAGNYPQTSPYTFSGNNPVNFIDPSGDRIVTYIDGEEWEFMEGEYGYGFYNSAGELFRQDTNDFIDYLTEDLNILVSKNEGHKIISSLIECDETIIIRQTNRRDNKYVPNDKTVYYDIYDTSGSPIFDSHTRLINGSRPQFIGLGHELAHAYDDITGRFDSRIWCNESGESKIYMAEISAMLHENILREEHNLPLRVAYYSYKGISSTFLNLIDRWKMIK
ncbi:MAG: hypothetical protein K2K55_06125 [Duncaniella sp.]|nr:hypothetical protein [Duncaniella sp.]